MKDPHIRLLLRRTELLQYINDPTSRVVEELKIPVANARIDMAVINGHFHGYEIKSACDTLQRLPNQLIAYSYIFDYLTVITEEKYSNKILSILPDWVGLSICSDSADDTIIEVIKRGKINTQKNGFYLAKLLWNEELIDLLIELEIPFKKKQRNWLLCEIISQNVDTETLSRLVREKLKIRTAWKLREDSPIA